MAKINQKDLEILLEKCLSENRYVKFCKKHKIKLAPEFYKIFTEDMHKYLLSDKNDVYYEIKNNKCVKLYTISRGSDIGSRMIMVTVFIDKAIKKSDLKLIIKQARALDRRIKNVFLEIDETSHLHQEALTQKGNFKGSYLIATTFESLKYFRNQKMPNDISFRPLKPSQILLAADLEKRSHEHSESTRCVGMNRSMFAGLFKSCIKHKQKIIVAYVNNEIVGHIVPGIRRAKMGHVMTIVVDPKFQGKGISKWLYHQALLHWKKNAVKVYSGTSTTHQVLGFSNKLKRQKVKVIYQF
jgi:predicted GNAT family acetyltransferase